MPSKLKELRLDVAELNKLLSTAERQKVKDILSVEIRKLETEITNLKELSDKESVTDTSVTSVPPSKPKRYEAKLNNYAWDQSDKFVKIFVTLKNVQTVEAADVFCVFTSKSVELKVNGLDNRNYTLPITHLLEEIDADKSYWKVKTGELYVYCTSKTITAAAKETEFPELFGTNTYNIVIFLAKKKVGTKWSHMTTYEKKAKEPRIPKLDQNDDPSAGLMDMMRQMYEDGDDDMKRTIAKAWTESREKQMTL